MTELQDLRGESISWMVSRRKPLLCAVSRGADTLGSLVQDATGEPIRAILASVRWRLAREKREDVLRFEDAEMKVASGAAGLGIYEAWIDGAYRYRLECLPRERRASWVDAQRKTAMVFRRHLYSHRSETGDVVTGKTSTLEHAPVLLILGLVHLLKHPRLMWDLSA